MLDLPQELIEAQQRVDANIAGMVHAIANHQFERGSAIPLANSENAKRARTPARCLREKYGDEYGTSVELAAPPPAAGNARSSSSAYSAPAGVSSCLKKT